MPSPRGTRQSRSRDSAFIAHLQEVFVDFGDLSAKPMFGGHGIYHDGLMLGLVADEVLYLKVDESTRRAFEAAGCSPFEYVKNGKAIKMSFYSAPESVFEDRQQARDWARLAYAAAQRSRERAPARKPPPARSPHR